MLWKQIMKTRTLTIALALCALLAGCTGQRKAATEAAPSRYRRAPIREVSEEQLKLDNRLVDALTLEETGHSDEALAAYAALTRDEPGLAAAWYGQAQLLLARGWTDSALHCARRAVELQGDNAWYLLALAQACRAAGDSKGLTDTWERLVRQNPDRLEYYYELSNAYLAAGDLAAAIGALDRVERRVGVTEPVSLQKQRLWEAGGHHDKAMKEMEALANALPQEKRYQAILAEMNMERKNYRKAKQYYDRILAADPQDEYIHLQLAEYHKRLGHPAEADSEMVRAFANPRLDARTKLQLLTSFYTEEEFYGSRSAVCTRLVEMVVAQNDAPEETALLYGDVLMRQRRYAEAADQLAAALRQDSARYEVWEGLLICLTECPDREEEMADYSRRAERLFPMHTLPHHLTGLVHLRHERYAEAVGALEKAVQWGFNKGYLEAETYGLLAEAYYRNGQYDKAWRAFDRVVALHPDDWGTLNNYAYYLGERGVRLEEALAMSRRTIDAEPENANSLDTYAWLLHLLGRDREALPYAERAARLNPASDTLRRHLETIKNGQ